MYEEFIRSAFMKDLLWNLFYLIWIPVIYFGFGLYKEEGRGCALIILIPFFGGAALVDFATKWAYYVDYVNYLRQGDSYVMEKTCVVEDAYDSLSTAIVYAEQELECSDGTHLELRHRRDYQRIYPKVGRAFRVWYLPGSGMVVGLEPLDGAKPLRPYVPAKAMQKEVAGRIRTIFRAPDRAPTECYPAEAVAGYQKRVPKPAAWMETNLPEGLTVFDFTQAHWRRLRTTNTLERLNREIRRRTRVVSIFPNEASCPRLITALLMETGEVWGTGRVYPAITDT